ncbi:putative formyl-CoA transferase, NAD(P)-binding; caiB/baiF CoA-transferase family [Cupriavidus taiwanensis]|uniref:Formyl-CoA transferase, NAD(P)-binding caiB/baiF CoA-transferase family n=1 Tax=Cupriavidus taiwanensis TaxID=164546 RepID=A0A375C6W6_9BURK|nr:putative formyl-CoA transferase, NAD(P)-binding; caiB/baiF CoA-transferase family [Cupriavidus taiwanensis]
MRLQAIWEQALDASSHSDLPLAGIRVIDFSRVLAGPYCTALLGDLGAEVIKIEPPGGDDYRAVGPFVDGRSGLFAAMNRNKQSIVIDLKTAAGLELARALCVRADVVVENFRPGVADKLGIGYAALRALNPALVYASVSGFGQTGPESHRPAYDIILQALCGLMDATGAPDGAPTMLGEAVSDAVSGLFASWGVLAALLAREKNGRGTHVDVSMFDATLSLSATLVARYAATGRAPQRVGNRHPSSAPFGVYRAADGFYVVAVLNNKLFHALAETIGCPEMAHDPRFADDASRCRFEPALRAGLEAWSSGLSVAEVNRLLGAAGIPVAPIRNVRQALESEQAVHRRLLTEVAGPDGSAVRLPSQPVKFSGYGPNRVTPAPELGQHTEAILAAHDFSKEKQHA